MNAWIQVCTAVLEDSESVLIFRVPTPANARMDCSTSTTLARVRKNAIVCKSFNYVVIHSDHTTKQNTRTHEFIIVPIETHTLATSQSKRTKMQCANATRRHRFA